MRTNKKPLRELKPFDFGCSLAVFPPEELEALTQEGSRLESLVAGQISAVSAADRHFLRVDRGEAEPKTLLERAWLRLKGRREFEQEQKGHTTQPPQDYGMVEFDADRCWW